MDVGETVIFALALALMTIAAWKTVEANPARLIPPHKRPENCPLPTILLRMVGYSLTTWTVINIQDQWGLYTYLLFAVMVLPELILYTIHNRGFKERNAATG